MRSSTTVEPILGKASKTLKNSPQFSSFSCASFGIYLIPMEFCGLSPPPPPHLPTHSWLSVPNILYVHSTIYIYRLRLSLGHIPYHNYDPPPLVIIVTIICSLSLAGVLAGAPCLLSMFSRKRYWKYIYILYGLFCTMTTISWICYSLWTDKFRTRCKL